MDEHAACVDGQDAVPLGHGHFHNHPVHDARGIVHQDIEPPEMLDGSLHSALCGCLFSDVTLQRYDFTVYGQRIYFGLDVFGDDLGATSAQQVDGGLADAARGAGDDSDLAFQVTLVDVGLHGFFLQFPVSRAFIERAALTTALAETSGLRASRPMCIAGAVRVHVADVARIGNGSAIRNPGAVGERVELAAALGEHIERGLLRGERWERKRAKQGCAGDGERLAVLGFHDGLILLSWVELIGLLALLLTWNQSSFDGSSGK